MLKAPSPNPKLNYCGVIPRGLALALQEAAEGIDALERARKKREAPGQGGRRVALAREEQLALQSR